MCVRLQRIGPECERACACGWYHWVSLLVSLKSDPNAPKLPDGEYSQTFHLARQAGEASMAQGCGTKGQTMRSLWPNAQRCS